MPRTSGSTEARWHEGLLADEGVVVCRPRTLDADTATQTTMVYRALATALCEHGGASFGNLTSERLFLRDRQELPRILEARDRVLGEMGQPSLGPAPVVIEQPPIDENAALELAGWAIVPHTPPTGAAGNDLKTIGGCHCEACSQSGARLQRLADECTLHSTILYGCGENTFEQAREMFRTARRLLQSASMDFHDVVRTWIYLEDIDRDYDALNRARREFFDECGLQQRPASTGVQGVPCSQSHSCGLSLQAITPRPREVARMSTPYLNEAWSYGADFSRGLRVAQSNGTMLHLSGTASIDEAGHSLYPGDIEAQAERMIDNIESLLGEQGVGFSSLLYGVTYVKRPGDAKRMRAVLRKRGFDGFPCVAVIAPLCRPELLCETEAVAVGQTAVQDSRASVPT